jgi:FemAB-related protein (PEP-CTERM system-associated)
MTSLSIPAESGPTLDQGAASVLRTRRLAAEDTGAWDGFVRAHPEGSFFQLTGWKRVIEKTFGYQVRYLLAERDGRIAGIAPLFLVSNWILGRCLLSVPFGVYGGLAAEDDEAQEALILELKRLAESDRCDYLELRQRRGPIREGYHHNPLYSTFTCELYGDPERNLKQLPRDTRYMIRKGEKAGLEARYGTDQLKVFYDLFAENLRHHGTPLFPYSLFVNLVEEFREQLSLLMVYHKATPVSGVLSFKFRHTILPYYAGAGADATRLAANNFMYWTLMRDAAREGFRCFDFGRSKKGTGSFAFKSQWNMNVEELQYQLLLVRRKTVPNFSPANPKFKRMADIWQRLPAWLSRRVGPHVAPWFP